jgi:hypothetical protein
VVILLDACHAAGVMNEPSGAAGPAGEPYGRFLNELRSQYLLFASCGPKELSYEDTLGLRAGVFAHYLAEGLAGNADREGDGAVQFHEVVDYAETAVQDWCRTHFQPDDPPQNPVRLPSDWSTSVPLAITPIKAAREALTRLAPHLSAAEQQKAQAALASGTDRAILAEWLLELDAALEVSAPRGLLVTSGLASTQGSFMVIRRIAEGRPSPPTARPKIGRGGLSPGRLVTTRRAWLLRSLSTNTGPIAGCCRGTGRSEG